MIERACPLLLVVLVTASFFHIQAAVIAVVMLIILMPLNKHLTAIKMIKYFAILMIPVLCGFVCGIQNSTYLILKDLYYFLCPVLFILCGIILAYRIKIEDYLKVLVFLGVITSIIVTCISIDYSGFSVLTNPYSAHYAIGIVGAPAPCLALACLLFSKKFNIRLYTNLTFKTYLAINAFGIYMFASRTYFIITICFVLLLLADRIRKTWIVPMLFLILVLIITVPSDLFRQNSSNTFLGKILGSFNEISIGNYSSDQDINTRYRGYESFMALKGFAEGDLKDWIFGGLGKLINLRTFVRLGEDTDFQFIPVLHNGWLYLLVKTGIAGVATYLILFLSLVIKTWKKYSDQAAKPIIRFFAAIIIGCVLSLMLTNYIVVAFFNVEMSLLMITLGFSYINLHALMFKLEEYKRAAKMEYA